MFEDGSIFKIGYENSSRLVSEKDNYSIREGKSQSQHSQSQKNDMELVCSEQGDK